MDRINDLKNYMEKYNITAKELAGKLGYSPRVMEGVFNGDIFPESAEQLLKDAFKFFWEKDKEAK